MATKLTLPPSPNYPDGVRVTVHGDGGLTLAATREQTDVPVGSVVYINPRQAAALRDVLVAKLGPPGTAA